MTTASAIPQDTELQVDVDALLRQYRSGDPAAAVQTVAALDDAGVLALALPETDNAPALLATVALLHLEAGIRSGRFMQRLPNRPLTSSMRPLDYGAHFHVSLDAVNRLSTVDAPWIRDFVGRWLVVAESYATRRSGLRASVMDTTASRFARETGWLQLLQGSHREDWMGPARTGPGAYLHKVPDDGSPEAMVAVWRDGKMPPDVFSSSHGRFSRNAFQAAEAAFKRAATFAETSIEARVRLGRIYYLTDRLTEAGPPLEAALKEALTQQQAVLAYWAALQLGLVHDQQGQLDAAATAYETAAKIHPAGRSARLALGAMAVRQGRPADAWQSAAAALGPSTESGRGDLDPWTLYPFRQYWRVPELLSSLRQTVRALKDPT